jgi:hypothetical protein
MRREGGSLHRWAAAEDKDGRWQRTWGRRLVRLDGGGPAMTVSMRHGQTAPWHGTHTREAFGQCVGLARSPRA